MFEKRKAATAGHERYQSPRTLRARNLAEEDVPPQARAVWGSIDEQVGIVAALIHNIVVDPHSAKTWHNQRNVDAVAPAFAKGLALAQQEAGDLSLPEDEQYLQHANQADQYADLAGSLIEDTQKIVDDTVEHPPGARPSGRETIARHRADRELAASREHDGDSRHQQRPIDRYLIVLAAAVLAALDILLLWRPLLNLGQINSAGALFKWTLAVVFAGAQALAMDLVIHHYREHERENHELRDALKDHARVARQGLAMRDLVAATRPSPSTRDLDHSDMKLRAAYRWLLAIAAGVGMIGVIRVAFLSRGSGQSIVEATLFGSFVGLMLGVLVLLLGMLACRGNRLGDRLWAGAAVVADLEHRIQQGAHQVEEARDASRLELTAAAEACARADDTREWVLGQYWQALLLAAGWLGLSKPMLEQNDLVVPRRLAISGTAAAQVQTVTTKLDAIDKWLARPALAGLAPPTPQAPGHTIELTSSSACAAPGGRLVDPPQPGERGGLVRVGIDIKPPPSEPRWLIVIAATVAVALAFVAAVLAPTAGIVTSTSSGSPPSPAAYVAPQ